MISAWHLVSAFYPTVSFLNEGTFCIYHYFEHSLRATFALWGATHRIVGPAAADFLLKMMNICFCGTWSRRFIRPFLSGTKAWSSEPGDLGFRKHTRCTANMHSNGRFCVLFSIAKAAISLDTPSKWWIYVDLLLYHVDLLMNTGDITCVMYKRWCSIGFLLKSCDFLMQNGVRLPTARPWRWWARRWWHVRRIRGGEGGQVTAYVSLRKLTIVSVAPLWSIIPIASSVAPVFL